MNNKEIEIVIADDNPDDAELVIRALKKQNLANNLVRVADGVEILDFMYGRGEFEGRNTNIHPKVIFLDLKMPRLNGLEALQKIKSDPELRSIPVVMLTSSAEDPDIKKAYDLGANSYIVKPIDFGVFIKTVSELGFYWVVTNKIVT